MGGESRVAVRESCLQVDGVDDDEDIGDDDDGDDDDDYNDDEESLRTTTTTVMMKAGLGFGPAWRGACGIIGIESR